MRSIEPARTTPRPPVRPEPRTMLWSKRRVRPGAGLEIRGAGLLSRPPTPSVGGGLPSSLRSSPGQPGEQGPRPSAPPRVLPLRSRPRTSAAVHAPCLPYPKKLIYPTCPCPAPSSGSASLHLDITSYVNLGWARLCQCERFKPSRESARLRASCHARTLVASRVPAARPPPWKGGSPS